MFRDAAQRGLAIGAWFACFMGGALIGPMVGGALLARFWWGSCCCSAYRRWCCC